MLLIIPPLTLYTFALVALFTLIKTRSKAAHLSALAGMSGGIIFHGFLLSHQILGESYLNIGALKALSLTGFIMMIIVLPKAERHLNSAFAITALALVSVIASAFHSDHAIEPQSIPLGAHIVTSIVAYAILLLAGVQAILILLRDRALKHPKPSFLTKNLPPILRMERWLFQLILIGWVLLTLSLLSSAFFLDLWFTQSTIHKTVLTLAAWFLYGGLLIGHYRYHIRGRRAAKLVLISTLVLLLAITGTRLIQELIFHRS